MIRLIEILLKQQTTIILNRYDQFTSGIKYQNSNVANGEDALQTVVLLHYFIKSYVDMTHKIKYIIFHLFYQI